MIILLKCLLIVLVYRKGTYWLTYSHLSTRPKR